MRPGPGRSDWLKKFGLLLGSTALALLLAEAGLRVRWHCRHRAVVSRHSDSSGKISLQPSDEPGLFYTFRVDSRGTNSRGYPDVEHDLEKDPDVFRIVVIGDSVAAGHYVGWRRSVCRLLEARLNELSPNRGFEVVSLACPGYSTSQELVLLRNEVFRYHPDLVLWSYVLNDPADPVFHDANGELGMLHEPKIHLLSLANQVWFRLKETAAAWGGPTEFHRRLHYVYWDQVERNLGEIGRLGREHHVPIVFLIHPLHEASRRLSDYPLLDVNENLVDLARRCGLAPLDLRAAYRGYSLDSLGYEGDIWHPNVLGHQLAADYLCHWLDVEGWLSTRDEERLPENRALPKN